MYKISIFIIAFKLMNSLAVSSYSAKMSTCEIFENILIEENFEKHFDLADFDEDIILLDREEVLKTCQFNFHICHKDFSVEKAYEFKLNNAPISLIVLHEFHREDSKLKVKFWQPYPGGKLSLTYLVLEHQLKLIKTNLEAF